MPITDTVLSSWSEIHSYARPSWIYRGQRSAEWELVTSLERCCDREEVVDSDRLRLEKELRRDFQRVYHQYAQHIPAQESLIEWTSLMQHHGAPTRLLDFSYSIYVAAYFALENADEDCAVWCVSAPWALRESVALLLQAGKDQAITFQAPTQMAHEIVSGDVIFANPAKCIVPLTPFRQNDRLRTQRGTFLVPGQTSSGFMDNLREMPGCEDDTNLVKLVLPRRVRAEALEHLYSMNISRTSLFPGLDGYAQSLGIFHPSFRPIPW
jgi:hypothetical protein